MNTTGNQRRAVLGKLTRAVVSLTTLLATMLLALGLGSPGPAEAQTTQSVTLYDDVWLTGASLRLSGSVADLRTYGFNDRTSSIELSGLTVVAAYEHINYTGRCETFREIDDVSLVDNQIGNNTISSLRFGQPCSVLLWSEPNYVGNILTASGDVPDLGLRFSNDMASLKAQGNRVALYDGPNYTGLCENFTGDENDLRDNPMLQRASSLRINADCARQAVLFTDINYGGDYFLVPFLGPDRWTDLAPLGWKNRASSVYLSQRAELVVADDDILGLTLSKRFTENQPDLRWTYIGNDTIDRVLAD